MIQKNKRLEQHDDRKRVGSPSACTGGEEQRRLLSDPEAKVRLPAI